MQVFHLLLSVVRNKITAIFIGAAGIGAADIYSKSAEFIGHLTQLGLGVSGVRRIAQLYESDPKGKALLHSISSLRSWVLVTAVLGAVFMLLLAPLLAYIFLKDSARWMECTALAPLVFFSALFSGEITILKATRQLKKLALSTLIGALLTLFITVPLYVFFERAAIIPVLILSSVSLFGVYFLSATHHYPYKLNFTHTSFKQEGLPMLRLGASFVLAGVSTTAAELCVRSFINWQSNEAFVGFYSVGFTLVVSYARIIFVAVDADYFPRLTAIAENHREMNQLINRQIDALVMLMAPFLITFAIGLPYIIRLLYTQEFLCVVPMVLAALCYMLFKAVYTPIAYLPLAKGDSRVYLFMELLYNSVFVTTVLLGYYFGGLLGAGLGLTVANLFDFLAINFYYTRRYQFRMKRLTLLRTLAQLFILLLTLAICFVCDGVAKYTVGTFLLLTSLMCSFRVWKQNK